MRKILIAVPAVLAAAAVLASPASAGTTAMGADVLVQLGQLDNQIGSAEQRDQITSRDASKLARQVDQIGDLQLRYERGGFTRPELRLLGARIDKVEAELAAATGEAN